MSRVKNWKVDLALIAIVILVGVIAVALLSLGSDKDDDKPTAPAVITLSVSGSGGTTAVLEVIKPAFEAENPGYRIEPLTGTGTGGGVKGVLDGTLDLAAMARAPKDDEAVAYMEFGKAGQALFVNAGVGDISLTNAQASDIIFGKITNWSEVGGPDLAIVVYVRDEADSTTSVMRKAIFGDAPFPTTAQVMTSQGDMIRAVEGIEGAIGMGSWPAVMAAGGNVKPVILENLTPDDVRYPVTGPLGVGYLETRQADVQPLIDWLQSENGKAALLKLGVLVE
jgi:phosphate transport system substrate-binding protein